MRAAEHALAGRREATLLSLPSVRRMADLLVERCREESWVRTSVASLDRFRTTLDDQDLEGLLERSRADIAVAERALGTFERTFQGHADTQVAALVIGPQIWFHLNGVATAWRLHTRPSSPQPLAVAGQHAVDRLALLMLIGSGLHLAELLRLRVGDVGSLDTAGQLIPDRAAVPLAVRYIARRRHPRENITFLTLPAGAALNADLDRRAAAGQALDRDAPLIARRDGRPATASTVAYARRRNSALIRVGNAVNVSMCRATGDFFRVWGMPGARFVETPALERQEVS
jgi:hypothetical protein